MCSTSLFTYIRTMIFKFLIIFIISLFMFELFLEMYQVLVISYNLCCLFVNGVIFFCSKLIIFVVFFLKDSQKLFIQSLLIVYNLKCPYCRHEIPTGSMFTYFFVGDFSGLILYLSTFLIENLRST